MQNGRPFFASLGLFTFQAKFDSWFPEHRKVCNAVRHMPQE